MANKKNNPYSTQELIRAQKGYEIGKDGLYVASFTYALSRITGKNLMAVKVVNQEGGDVFHFPLIVEVGESLEKTVLSVAEALKKVPGRGRKYRFTGEEVKTSVTLDFTGKEKITGKGMLLYGGETWELSHEGIPDVLADQTFALFTENFPKAVAFCLAEVEKKYDGKALGCEGVTEEELDDIFAKVPHTQSIRLLNGFQEKQYIDFLRNGSFTATEKMTISGKIDRNRWKEVLEKLTETYDVMRCEIVPTRTGRVFRAVGEKRSISFGIGENEKAFTVSLCVPEFLFSEKARHALLRQAVGLYTGEEVTFWQNTYPSFTPIETKEFSFVGTERCLLPSHGKGCLEGCLSGEWAGTDVETVRKAVLRFLEIETGEKVSFDQIVCSDDTVMDGIDEFSTCGEGEPSGVLCRFVKKEDEYYVVRKESYPVVLNFVLKKDHTEWYLQDSATLFCEQDKEAQKELFSRVLLGTEDLGGKVLQGEKTQESFTTLVEKMIWESQDVLLRYQGKDYTRKEVLQKSKNIAYAIHRKIGSRQVVALRCERSEKMIIALFGIILSGNVYLPVGCDYPEERVAYMIRQADAKMIIEDTVRKDTGLPTIVLSEYSFGEETFTDTSLKPDDIAYILFTSGSTGRPKGAKISHRAISNRIEWMEKCYPIQGGRILQKTPYTFDVSLWELFWNVLYGGTMVIMPPEQHADVAEIYRVVRQEKITHVHFVPSMYDIFLEYTQGKEIPVKHLFLSGEKLKQGTVKKHYRTFPETQLHNLYGPTECAVDVTYYDCYGDEKEIPLGFPIDNCEITVENGVPLPPYVNGEIVIAGVPVGCGYVGGTEGGFVEGKYRTGDVGWYDEKGILYFVGRKDSQVKINGQRTETSEIEKVVEEACGSETAVTVSENGIVLAYVLGEGNEKEIMEACQNRLPSFMIPAAVVFLSSFPLTANGKIDKKKLPALQEKRRNAPIGKREEFLANLLGTTDRREEIFSSPRTSRDIQKALYQIDREGYALSVRRLFEGRTVEKIASFLRRKGETVEDIRRWRYTVTPSSKEEFGAPSLTEEEFLYLKRKYGEDVERIYPVTPLQEGMMYHGLDQGLFPEYITQRIVHIAGVHRELAKNAIYLLGIRYDILRTAFVILESGSYQVLLRNRKPEISVAEGDPNKIAAADLVRGFDLATESLFRFTIVGDKVVQTAHHIILDGWSEGVLWDAFVRYYHRLLQGEDLETVRKEAYEESITKPRFEEYVSYIRSKDKEKAKKYFRGLMDGFSGATRYPSENSGIRMGRAAEIQSSFPAELAEEISLYAVKNGVTVSILTQAVWGILLAKANGVDDVVFGNVVSGRSGDILGVEEMVGMFINTVPVRYKIKGSFRSFLAQATMQGAETAEYSYLALSDSGADIQTITVFENFGKDENEFVIEEELDQSSYDLEFELSDEENFRFVLYYNANLYAKEDMESFLTYMQNIFRIVLKNDSVSVEDIEFLSEEEKARFARMSEKTTVAKPKKKTKDKPLSEREKCVEKCFCEVLSLSQCYRDDDFFEVGGDSIKAIRLSAKLRTSGYRVTVKEITVQRTLAEIASVMERISDRENCYGIFEPSYEQKLFLQGEFGAEENYLDVLCRIDKKIFNAAYVKKALHMLYDRHDMLRARIAGGRTVVRPPESAVELPLRIVHLSGENVNSEIEKECFLERQRILLHETGLFRSVIFETDGDGYLYFCPHHYVADSVSLEILATEFMSLYRSMQEGKEPVFGKNTTPYPVWSDKVAHADLTKEERKRWACREEAMVPYKRNGTEKAVTEKVLSVAYADIMRAGKKFGADGDCVFLTALSKTLYEQYGCERKIITKEGHGRQAFEDVDVSGTVGWFTTEYPVLTCGSENVVEAFLHNKEEIYSVPDGGIRYGNVAKTRSDVLYNFVGEGEIEEKDFTFMRFPYRLENVGKELYDVEIGIKKGYPVLTLLSNGLTDEEIARFVEKYEKNLSVVVKTLKKTDKISSPADYGMAGLTREDFDDVLQRVSLDNLEEIAPLTFLQEGMLYHTLTLPENREYVEQNITEFPFPFDKATIYQAVQLLAKRFGVLRTKYILCQSGRYLQAVQKNAEIPVSFSEEDYREVAEREVRRGFDPFTEPSVRTVFVPSEKGFIFIWTYHHVSYDAWSDAKIVKSFVEFYKKPRWTERLEEEKRQEKTFCAYARKIRKSDLETLYEYWDSVVSGGKRTAIGKGKVGGRTAEIDRRLRCGEEIGKFALRKKVKENSVLEAAAALLLKLITGQDDVLFGKVVSGKTTEEGLTDSVGLYINTVPVRSTEESVEKILAEIDRQALVADKNGVCSYAEILRRNKMSDPVDFLFVNNAFTEEVFPDREDFSIIDVRDSTNYNITFSVFDKESYGVGISYYEGRIHVKEASLYLDWYEKCLEFILSGSGYLSDIRKALGCKKKENQRTKIDERQPENAREEEILNLCRTVLPDIDFCTPFSEFWVSSIDRIKIAVRLSKKGVTMSDVSLAESVCDICRPHKNYFITLTKKGNRKAIIGIPYAGASGRIYTSLAQKTEGYDFYASLSSSYAEQELPLVRKELRRIEEEYDEVQYYGHCVGGVLLLDILPSLPKGKVIIGGYIPDRITSVFGRPLNGWKNASNEEIENALQKAGLHLSEEKDTVFEKFRIDTELVAIAEAKKREKLPYDCEVLLANDDPFAREIRLAKKRYLKYFKDAQITVFPYRGHYFIDTTVFYSLLTEKLEEK